MSRTPQRISVVNVGITTISRDNRNYRSSVIGADALVRQTASRRGQVGDARTYKITFINQTERNIVSSFGGVSREISRERTRNNRTRIIIKNAVGRRNDRFPFREIPTVTTFPRNDKLYRRMRRLIMFIRFKPKRTPVPPCHCEERNARRGNLPEGKTDEPYTTTPILARGGSPPWQSPGREMSLTDTRQPARPRWLTAEKSPATETITIVHDYPKYPPAVAHRREIPCVRNGTQHTRASPLARRGSLLTHARARKYLSKRGLIALLSAQNCDIIRRNRLTVDNFCVSERI